ncbi:hypothetical protein CEXT_762371 [Caerostris extrusa]|uniref:Uncharacterized protein n=1 Tax=Caerostris extrusa TaxID=172846 RepID=A0AAV4T0B4_CAEEX|nr:hypothetical protein CEXT_762371 [Caerostris extrusa]
MQCPPGLIGHSKRHELTEFAILNRFISYSLGYLNSETQRNVHQGSHALRKRNQLMKFAILNRFISNSLGYPSSEVQPNIHKPFEKDKNLWNLQF